MELSKNEAICIARHLIVQHRQHIYNRKSDIGEACSECPIAKECCIGDGEFIWHKLYPEICKNADLKCSFRIGQKPLVSYDK